jgi:hypothetical protein
VTHMRLTISNNKPLICMPKDKKKQK